MSIRQDATLLFLLLFSSRTNGGDTADILPIGSTDTLPMTKAAEALYFYFMLLEESTSAQPSSTRVSSADLFFYSLETKLCNIVYPKAAA